MYAVKSMFELIFTHCLLLTNKRSPSSRENYAVTTIVDVRSMSRGILTMTIALAIEVVV